MAKKGKIKINRIRECVAALQQILDEFDASAVESPDDAPEGGAMDAAPRTVPMADAIENYRRLSR